MQMIYWSISGLMQCGLLPVLPVSGLNPFEGISRQASTLRYSLARVLVREGKANDFDITCAMAVLSSYIY